MITLQDDVAMRVAVPLRFCFDFDSAVIKPPLAAVLDRLAKSQQDEPTLMRVTAMPDPRIGNQSVMSSLAANRSVSIREHLVGQGIDSERIKLADSSKSAGVVIVVSDKPSR
jgi:outer membrane protein OmpA-like peptidoglycan-associated protein